MNHPETSCSPCLLVVAAAIEARAIIAGVDIDLAVPLPWSPTPLAPALDLVVSGIGKTNAAAATALALLHKDYRSVISIGIAGALPYSGLTVGDAVLASASIYADEGLATPNGFQTCSEMGFPLGPFEGNAVKIADEMLSRLTKAVDRVGVIATVSTCSGTDALAAMVEERTGAIAECMEGAAVGHICATWSANRRPSTEPDSPPHPPTTIAFAEVRVISNTTGDRSKQQWNMKSALEKLSDVSRQVCLLVRP